MKASASASNLSNTRGASGAAQNLNGYKTQAAIPNLRQPQAPTYSRSTNSFAQKKSVAVPSLSHKSLRSPGRGGTRHQPTLGSDTKASSQVFDNICALM